MPEGNVCFDPNAVSITTSRLRATGTTVFRPESTQSSRSFDLLRTVSRSDRTHVFPFFLRSVVDFSPKSSPPSVIRVQRDLTLRRVCNAVVGTNVYKHVFRATRREHVSKYVRAADSCGPGRARRVRFTTRPSIRFCEKLRARSRSISVGFRMRRQNELHVRIALNEYGSRWFRRVPVIHARFVNAKRG